MPVYDNAHSRCLLLLFNTVSFLDRTQLQLVSQFVFSSPHSSYPSVVANYGVDAGRSSNTCSTMCTPWSSSFHPARSHLRVTPYNRCHANDSLNDGGYAPGYSTGLFTNNSRSYET
ncbi:hypothetical protein DFH08DRAFT_235493 [Mycena albidolilacea]|uniref:Uncharacterized protein n=1 Tax=Mycena albidolilacea TaxID=1033008 RepID=A0AAD6ZW75_9AGAR|nr:hypothetical protein DFH08DRAFT_235493 [Mycena albidolilacea]